MTRNLPDIDVPTNFERLARFARQPAISEGNRGVDEAAALLAQLHREIGFTEVEVAESRGLPGVWAYLDQGSDRTLLVYMMFDSGPVGTGWTRDPFAAETGREGAFPKVIYGKGIRTRGPYMAFLAAIDACVRSGTKLPVNIACVCDGEEFVGSTNYHELVERYASRVPGPIGGVNVGSNQDPAGNHSIALANKGCAYLDLRVSGATWGKGPVGSHVHSSAAAVVHSPAWRLVEALAPLVDGEGGTHVAIPGFYDDEPRPSAAARAKLEELVAAMGATDWKRATPGVAGFGEVGALLDDLTGVDLLQRALYGTTFNINGIRSGYVDMDSTLFTLPGTATARVDLRYAPPAHGRRLVELLRAHLDSTGFPEVEIIDLGTHDGSVAQEDDIVVRAALEAASARGISTTVWPMRPAGAPVGVFTEVLGVPTLGSVGLGFGGSSNGNEYWVVEGNDSVVGLEGAAQYYVDYLMALE